jgi:hypothetical protein
MRGIGRFHKGNTIALIGAKATLGYLARYSTVSCPNVFARKTGQDRRGLNIAIAKVRAFFLRLLYTERAILASMLIGARRDHCLIVVVTS